MANAGDGAARPTVSVGRRAGVPAGDVVRSWTGRSALSRVTDSALPHLVTSGTHRTRVSEMRLAAGRRARRSLGAPARPARPHERRDRVTARRDGGTLPVG